MKQKPKELEWEKQLKTFFTKFHTYEELEKLVSSLLTQQRTELLEEIKGLKIGERNENDGDDRSWNKFIYYYNQALDKVKNLLNKKDESIR